MQSQPGAPLLSSILGIGTDIIQITRIEELYKKFGERFLYKNYHELEIEHFHRLGKEKQLLFLAKRFAGKEAIAKAFGCGIGPLISFRDIAIVNNETGAPTTKIFSEAINEMGDHNVYISLSDDYPMALAFAIITR